jgi:hypothetical protein
MIFDHDCSGGEKEKELIYFCYSETTHRANYKTNTSIKNFNTKGKKKQSFVRWANNKTYFIFLRTLHEMPGNKGPALWKR